MLRASVAVRSRSRSAECEHATTGAARCGRLLGQDGRQGLPAKRPSSSSALKVLTVQRRNVCAQVGGDDRLTFSGFWSFEADDQGRSDAMPSAALSGDLERMKDIFESDDCSIFTQRPGVGEASLPDVLEHWTLRDYVELAYLRAARGSSRRHSLQAVLLWMERIDGGFLISISVLWKNAWMTCGL